MKRGQDGWAAPAALALALLAGSYLILFAVCRVRGAAALSPGWDPVVASLPRRDWTWLLSQGYVAFLACFFGFWLARDRRKLAFLLAATAVLMLVRDAFVLLTPVGPLPDLIPLYKSGVVGGLHDRLEFDGELFFSGHTGFPFLYFLLTRRERAVSLACLAVSLVNGLGVMVTRNHYAIDVLGAFAIVPTVSALSRRLFGWMDPEPVAA